MTSYPGTTGVVGDYQFHSTARESVETTGFNGADHAVETMDATSKAPALLGEDIPS